MAIGVRGGRGEIEEARMPGKKRHRPNDSGLYPPTPYLSLPIILSAVVDDRRPVVMVRGLGSSGPLSLSDLLPHISRV